MKSFIKKFQKKIKITEAQRLFLDLVILVVAFSVLFFPASFFKKGEYFSNKEMKVLWGELREKKENDRYNYLTEKQRREYIEKVSGSPIDSFNHKYYQVNLLKYRFGINNIEELDVYLGEISNGCNEKNLFIGEVNWDNTFQAGGYFDIVHFCGLDYNQEDVDKLNIVLRKEEDDYIKNHFLEHGVNNVPVYVNDCSEAKNENEEYHCLFFKD